MLVVTFLIEDDCLGSRQAKLDIGSKAMLVGRARNADLTVIDPCCSVRHALIHCGLDGLLMVTDLGSKHGTFVDGTKRTTARLFPGSRVRVGTTRLVVQSIEEEISCAI